jgi:ribonuclease Z
LCFGFAFETKGKKGTFQRATALKLGIPEGPLWGKLQRGESITHAGKKFTPEMVMDYAQGKRGTKIGFVMDTFPHNHYVDFFKGSDVLIHEASFLESEKERAWDVKHSTAKMAAEVAKHIGAKKLFLTHFSPRYKDGKDMLAEAKPVFANVIAAHDLMRVELEESYVVEAKKTKNEKNMEKKTPKTKTPASTAKAKPKAKKK